MKKKAEKLPKLIPNDNETHVLLSEKLELSNQARVKPPKTSSVITAENSLKPMYF